MLPPICGFTERSIACIIVSPSFCVTSSCFPKIATLISEGDLTQCNVIKSCYIHTGTTFRLLISLLYFGGVKSAISFEK